VTPICLHISRSGHVEQWGRTPVQMCLPNGTSNALISTHNARGSLLCNSTIVFSGVGVDSRDTISQIVLVWLIASVIGLGRLHHVVVGSVELLAGVFSGQRITAADYGRFLLFATLGNAVGGSFFVALIKYGYASNATIPGLSSVAAGDNQAEERD
jgi:hypothetical protein